MPVDDKAQSDFERGQIAGKIEARLAGHDQHFATINGSIEKVAKELATLTLAVQRLGDQAISRDATVITTAAALKDAEAARRNADDQSWSPIARFIAAAGVILTLATFYYSTR